MAPGAGPAHRPGGLVAPAAARAAGAVCAVDGCSAPVGPSGAHGWCPKHYTRWRVHGDPLIALPRGGYPRPVEELFWAKVDRDGPLPVARPELGPCWAWTAATRGGYGAFNVPATDDRPRRRVDAHRFAFEQHVGPVPDGYEIEHLCHTGDLDVCPGGPRCPHRACVNYEAHLVLVAAVDALRGVGAKHAAQTHCPRGHRYDLVDSAGHRRCGRCLRDQRARRRARHNGSDTARTGTPEPHAQDHDPTTPNHDQHDYDQRRTSP